ncbi:unnamed protein product [Phaedon cochleariae]|uniref:Tubulin--tyrosine ligase-like protein 5 n=1 Tax=Phaedon cochleariae TaxID=80249 RepID=A0A9N9X4Z4_PHACE|nr:unnamed protein product [Phaedon cochleariae]
METASSSSNESIKFSNLAVRKKSEELEIGRGIRSSLVSWKPLCSSGDNAGSYEPEIPLESSTSVDNFSTSELDGEEIIVQEPGQNTEDVSWLSGGQIGSRNSILIFRSSALANATDYSVQKKPAHILHITYKVLQAETKLLAKLLECHGIKEVVNNSSDFNLLWTGSHPKPGILRSLAPHQRVNHFPRSYELTRKDRLYKNIERMQLTKGYKHFDFIPQTFVMPLEHRELCTAHHRIKGPWIVKPVASSRGRGIFLVENPNQVPLEEPVVVAKYISNPLLIAGHKCDLRLYVAVTSFDPLLIYIYEEGLVRFATVKYDSSHKQLWNPCMHLCNYSINKYHSDYVKSDDPSAENIGHKWTLSALLRHLKAEGKDTLFLMSQIEDLIIKAILASANSIISACKMFVPYSNNCFELYGFDILIDKNLKPWLLEVNLSPSLNCDSPLDVRLKSAMLADLLTLVGVPAVDPVIRVIPTPVNKRNQSLKMKFNHCRRIHSADGLNNSHHKHQSTSSTSTISYQLSPEESRIIRSATTQFERRGGFVRIFPAIDSWAKYSQYLDPTTGIPISGTPSSSYGINVSHNYNLILHKHFFPGIITISKNIDRSLTRTKSTDRKSNLHNNYSLVDSGGLTGRHDRYERMLKQGHKANTVSKKSIKTTHKIELKDKVMEMLKSGKKISQCEARKTFSQYLICILKRIVSGPEEKDYVEVVLKFLQRASNFLRSSYSMSPPNTKLDYKARAAIVAKQLNDFLYIYNKETELFIVKNEKINHVPSKLYEQFLECAEEDDLEEVLIHQTNQNMSNQSMTTGFRGILKCIPNAPRSHGLKAPLTSKNKHLNIASIS